MYIGASNDHWRCIQTDAENPPAPVLDQPDPVTRPLTKEELAKIGLDPDTPIEVRTFLTQVIQSIDSDHFTLSTSKRFDFLM